MKIQIPKSELLRVLSKSFSVDVSEVDITDDDASPLADVVRKIVTALDYKLTQKIAAIKALRQAASDNKWQQISLADAKWAIEHFSEFIAFVERYNRLPKDGYYNGLK